MELSYIPPVAHDSSAMQTNDAVNTAAVKDAPGGKAGAGAGAAPSGPPSQSGNPNIGSIINTVA